MSKLEAGLEKADLAKVSDHIVPDLDSDGYVADHSLGDDLIYIDPEQEKAVMAKFDKYLLPQAFFIILLNYLDRSNLGK